MERHRSFCERAAATSVGRAKNKARIEQMLQQADFDKTYLTDVLHRDKLKPPTS
ncbi:MAG TPA: hypothetical protein P5038_04215 [Candidatus Paceibacterota bacterium]|nr:hypothetical protein [Candidatus Paceibacterota bacterium]